MRLSRRTILQALHLAGFSLVGLSRCAPSARAAWPRLLGSSTAGGVRTFSGPAAPEDVEVVLADGTRKSLYALFPNPGDPFGIDPALELGDGGWGLAVIERFDAPTDAPRPLNMIPFGVALDGALLDPSGPWYDGGAPDPRNPFDRACSGWEYDPLSPAVAPLVGLPLEVRGHVQPGPGGRPGSRGTFHYHGAPSLLLARLRAAAGALTEPLVVGWSADGYRVIDARVPGTPTVHLFSGWVLREGARAAQSHTNPSLTPAGDHDGTFVQDWEFDPARKRRQLDEALRTHGEWFGLTRAALDAGTATFQVLDASNGLSLADGYVYALTPDWPEVPRWFAAEPSPSFRAVIPLDAPAGGPPARRALYDACAPSLADVHRWSARAPY